MPSGSSLRHSWLKVKLHIYICRKCGSKKVNVEKSPNNWVAEWHTPDGDVIELRHAPPCAAGPLTAERLQLLAAWESRQQPTTEVRA